MASLFITVWDNAGSTPSGPPLQYMTPVTVDGTSRQSVAVTGDAKKIRTVRLFTDTDCFVTWGENPVVTGGSDAMPLGAENPEYVSVEALHLIAVLLRS